LLLVVVYNLISKNVVLVLATLQRDFGCQNLPRKNKDEEDIKEMEKSIYILRSKRNEEKKSNDVFFFLFELLNCYLSHSSSFFSNEIICKN